MTETAWWAVIVLVTNALTAVVISSAYRQRIYALKRSHADAISKVEQEQANVRLRERDVELKERMYGALPYVQRGTIDASS